MRRPLTPLPLSVRCSQVVIMPFLGGAMGAGHSELGNRFEYLKACFWCVRPPLPAPHPRLRRLPQSIPFI